MSLLCVKVVEDELIQNHMQTIVEVSVLTALFCNDVYLCRWKILEWYTC